MVTNQPTQRELFGQQELTRPDGRGGRSLTEIGRSQAVAAYEAGKSARAIAVTYGVDHGIILRAVHGAGIVIRSVSDVARVYALDESVFDRPLSREAAYFVGLLMADGCVIGREVSLTLTESDAEHVEEFRRFLGSGRPACLQRRGGFNGRSRPVIHLAVNSARLATALGRFGVTPRKSHTAKVKLLEKDADFWRGMICGDGDLGLFRQRYARVRLSGSADCVEQWRLFVHSVECRGRHPAGERIHRNNSAWAFSTSGARAYAVIAALFADATATLPRKLEVARFILDNCNPANGRLP